MKHNVVFEMQPLQLPLTTPFATGSLSKVLIAMTPVFSRQFLLWLGNVCLLVLWATLNIHWSLGSTSIKLTTVGFSAVSFCWVCHFVLNRYIPLAYTIAHIYNIYIPNTRRFNQSHFFCQHYMVYSMSNKTLGVYIIFTFSPKNPIPSSRLLRQSVLVKRLRSGSMPSLCWPTLLLVHGIDATLVPIGKIG